MHLKEIARGSRFRRPSSLTTRNVESSILAKSISSENMRFTKYGNLRKYMRLEEGYESECSEDFTGRFQRSASFSSWGRRKLKSISVLNAGKFNRNIGADEFADKPESHEMKEPSVKVKVKKRSSWFPDPCCRWPVQGW